MLSLHQLLHQLLFYPFFLADGPLPDPEQSRQPPPDVQTDHLIDQNGQFAVYVGAFLLIFAVAALVGVFSRRVEHAIMTAFALSAVMIVFFLFINHPTG